MAANSDEVVSWNMDDRLFIVANGKSFGGVVRYVGVAQFAAGVWVGCELDDPIGKNDGTVQGVTYFSCRPQRGIFVRGNQIHRPDSEAVAKAIPGGSAAKAASKAAAASAPKTGDVAATKTAAPQATPKQAGDASVAKATVAKATPKHVGAAANSQQAPNQAIVKQARSSSTGSTPSQAIPKQASTSSTGSMQSQTAKQPGAGKAASTQAIPKQPGGATTPLTPPKQASETPAAKAIAAQTIPKQVIPSPLDAAPNLQVDKKTASNTSSPKKAQAKQGPVGQASSAPIAISKAFPASPRQSDQAPEPSRDGEKTAEHTEADGMVAELAQLEERAAKLEKMSREGFQTLDALKDKVSALRDENQKLKAQSANVSSGPGSPDPKNTESMPLPGQIESTDKNLVDQLHDLAVEQHTCQKRTSILQPESDQHITRVKGLMHEIALERSNRELMELEMEEIEMKVDDLKAQAQEAEQLPQQWSEKQQLALHKKALWSFYAEHTAEMRRLQRKRVFLERLQAQQGSDTNCIDITEMRRTLKQLSNRVDQLVKENIRMENCLEERIGLRDSNLELSEAMGDIESILMEEVSWKKKRQAHLEALATQLYHGKVECQSRYDLQHGKVKKFELLLQTLRTDASNCQVAQDAGLENLNAAELEITLEKARARGFMIQAEAWASCIPPEVRGSAQLGRSFRVLCALHQCREKTRIFSRSAYDQFMKNVYIVMRLPEPHMRWLCSAAVAGAQVAYVATGVLGRIQNTTPQRYGELMEKAIFTSCAEAESTSDAAILVLQSIVSNAGDCGNRDYRDRQLAEVLAALGAQQAQLLSIQTSVFKDIFYASWQAAGYVVEAVRAATHLALYASDDAGGSRQKAWKSLHEKSQRLSRVLHFHSHGQFEVVGDNGQRKAPLLTTEPAEPVPIRTHAGQPQTDPSTTETEAKVEAVTSDVSPCVDDREPNVLASEGHLVQGLLDALFRQATVLSVSANSAPKNDVGAANLDRALEAAHGHLDALSEAIDARGGQVGGKIQQRGESKRQPWMVLREETRNKIQAGEAQLPAELTAEKLALESTDQDIISLDSEFEKIRQSTREVEAQYSVARLDAERCQLAETQCKALESQRKSGSQRTKELTAQLNIEKEKAANKNKAIIDLRQSLRELQAKIRQQDLRMQKRYNSQVPAQEVLTLRRTCEQMSRDVCSHFEVQANMKEQDAAPFSTSVSTKAASLGVGNASTTFWENLHRSLTSAVKDASGEDNAVETMRSATKEASERFATMSKVQESFDNCWQNVHSAQMNVLLEQTQTPVMRLEEPETEAASERLLQRIEELNKVSCKVRSDVTMILQGVTSIPKRGKGKKNTPGDKFTTVQVTRFLQETAAAAALGPIAKVSLPTPVIGCRARIAEMALRNPPAIPIMANADQMRQVHQALM